MLKTYTHQLTIRTPEGTEFSFELAGPFTRFLAWLLDLLVIVVVMKVLLIPTQILLPLSPNLILALNAIAYFVISVGYGMLLEWRMQGQTLGKRLLGIRVIDDRGLPLEFAQLALRNLLRAVDALPAFYLVGGICSILSSKTQRLGDLAAATVVMRIPHPREPDLSHIGTSKYNSLLEHGHLAARLRRALSPVAAEMALQALVRRHQFDPEARLALFRELAAYLRSVIAFPPEALEGLSDEQYVRNVVEIVFRPQRTGSSRLAAAQPHEPTASQAQIGTPNGGPPAR